MSCDPNGHCITCSDEGAAMVVRDCDEETGLGTCADEQGAEREVDLQLVGPLVPGDTVLVHAGVAIARLEGTQEAVA